MNDHPDIERHPLQPFLPANAQILMLGSFPPPKERWCMDFFYPNPQNDMWLAIAPDFFSLEANPWYYIMGIVCLYFSIRGLVQYLQLPEKK